MTFPVVVVQCWSDPTEDDVRLEVGYWGLKLTFCSL
jgi:hypothetical protein